MKEELLFLISEIGIPDSDQDERRIAANTCVEKQT